MTRMTPHKRRPAEFGESFYRFYIKVKNVNSTGSGIETVIDQLNAWNPETEGAVTGEYDPTSGYHITKISMGSTYPDIVEFGIKKI